MIPTKALVLAGARSYLGDDRTSGGQIATDTFLEQQFQMALRELYRALNGILNPFVRKERFYDLPANTGTLDPATAGLTDIANVELVEERGNVTQTTITNVVTASGYCTVTAAGHPFQTGDQAVIFNVVGAAGINGIWGVTYIDANSFKANGATIGGTYTSGGTASKSGDQFTEMDADLSIPDVGSTITTPSRYAWFDGRFHFSLSTALRELRITYISSAATVVNTTDTTGIDDSLDFLAIRTAGLFAASRGARDRAQELNSLALGPDLQANGQGGILRELVCTGVRAMQAVPTRRPPYRQRVNPNANTYY